MSALPSRAPLDGGNLGSAAVPAAGWTPAQLAGGTPALPDSPCIGKFSRMMREIFTRLG